MVSVLGCCYREILVAWVNTKKFNVVRIHASQDPLGLAIQSFLPPWLNPLLALVLCVITSENSPPSESVNRRANTISCDIEGKYFLDFPPNHPTMKVGRQSGLAKILTVVEKIVPNSCLHAYRQVGNLARQYECVYTLHPKNIVQPEHIV
jgi:hypothetical protein